MASWEELRSYIGGKYKVARDDGDLLTLVFSVNGDRSQSVLVARNDTGGGLPFATIASAVGEAAKLDLSAVLTELSSYVVGGAVVYGELLYVRHSVPLLNLDPNEFEGPLELVIHVADLLEKQFAGADTY